MISFIVIESPDYDSLGEYTFDSNIVTIGETRVNHFVIIDHWLIHNTVKLYLSGDSMFISSTSDKSFLVNNTSFKHSKKIIANDIITMGSTKIKITNFKNEYKNQPHLSKTLSNLKKEMKKQDKPRLELIIEIENQIARTETEK